MSKTKMSKMLKNVTKTLEKNSPQILTAVGIGGMLTTIILAVKATPKAMELIDEEIEKQDKALAKEADEAGLEVRTCVTSLKPIDTVKVTWKCYIPAVITGTLSAACLIGANSVHTRRTAALATAYKLSETALSDYKEKLVETVGEKKAQEVKDKIAEKKVAENPVSKTEVFITDKGKTLCLDAISGRYFESDIETIRRAVNEMNRNLINDMYVSLTEFYSEIGLSSTSMSDELGWNIDDGLIDIDFSSQIADDGRPCLVLEYSIAPRYDFSKLM